MRILISVGSLFLDNLTCLIQFFDNDPNQYGTYMLYSFFSLNLQLYHLLQHFFLLQFTFTNGLINWIWIIVSCLFVVKRRNRLITVWQCFNKWINMINSLMKTENVTLHCSNVSWIFIDYYFREMALHVNVDIWYVSFIWTDEYRYAYINRTNDWNYLEQFFLIKYFRQTLPKIGIHR